MRADATEKVVPPAWFQCWDVPLMMRATSIHQTNINIIMAYNIADDETTTILHVFLVMIAIAISMFYTQRHWQRARQRRRNTTLEEDIRTELQRVRELRMQRKQSLQEHQQHVRVALKM